MNFSFQTVWIIFGVTLVHLFVISALSPTGGGRRGAVSKANPVVSPETTIEQTIVAGESVTETDVPVEKKQQEETGEDVIAAPVNDLVETGTDPAPSTAVDQPALSSPPQVIREIRDLKPLRRS